MGELALGAFPAGEALGVHSEVGRLRRVLIHSPGTEVERMAPGDARALLYNDLLDLEGVQAGHGELRRVLSLVAEVLEVRELLGEVLGIPGVGPDVLRGLVGEQGARDLGGEEPQEQARAAIEGWEVAPQTFRDLMGGSRYQPGPLPNLYFSRDTAMCVGTQVVTGHMALAVRNRESAIVRALFAHHPRLQAQEVVDLGPHPLEGGDVQVVSPALLMVGLGTRTRPEALDRLVAAWARGPGPYHVIGVELPETRSMIHLDMVFTWISPRHAVVYPPLFLRRGGARCHHLRIEGNGRTLRSSDDLLGLLGSLGVEVDPIPCGGEDSLFQEREQWNSGANLFALAPYKAVSYAMHTRTLEACARKGYSVHSSQDVAARPSLLADDTPRIVTIQGAELARGGGGPRCMTCPILRDPVP